MVGWHKLHCTDFDIGLEEIYILPSVVLVTVMSSLYIQRSFMNAPVEIYSIDSSTKMTELFHSSKRGHTFLAHKPTAHCNIHTNLIYSFSKYIFTDNEMQSVMGPVTFWRPCHAIVSAIMTVLSLTGSPSSTCMTDVVYVTAHA